MFVVPLATPKAQPLVPIEATVVFVLDHVPPAVASEKQSVAPTHTLGLPFMANGAALTLTVTVPVVYDVPPPDNETTPDNTTL